MAASPLLMVLLQMASSQMAVGVAADGHDPNGSLLVAVGVASDGQDPNESLPIAVSGVAHAQNSNGRLPFAVMHGCRWPGTLWQLRYCSR